MFRKPPFVRLTVLTLLLVFVAEENARSAERRAADLRDIYVDAAKGRDLPGRGTQGSPLKSISAALAIVPDPVTEHVCIHLAPGDYSHTGGQGMPSGSLELRRRMRAMKTVRIVGEKQDSPAPADLGTVVLDWESTDGYPYLVQLGTRKRRQRQGISVCGPGKLRLRNARIHTRSFSGPALYAHRAGRIELAGTIEINEDLHEDRVEEESFAGVVATDHGSVKFIERDGASLSMGNGSLSASYYGVIRLGCRWARITSWGRQSNNIAVNNSGRVDLHGTSATLLAEHPQNTPIGLEHDGHVLAEGAHVVVLAQDTQNAIVLQKASTLFCNDVEIQGNPRAAVVAYSGSVFVGGFLGNLGKTTATTSAQVHVAKCTGQLVGPFEATRGATVTLPDGRRFPSAIDRQNDNAVRATSGSPVFPYSTVERGLH
ncbi:MAG: hypothetical protein ACYTG0_20845 [Planctomycetota bacterium]|jgi:hypothetical protein